MAREDANEQLNVPQAYIRQGQWCDCERSCNTALATLEEGVSVYEAKRTKHGHWQGTGSAFAKRERAFPGDRRRHLGGRAPWYLVVGRVIAIGADGEPLLKDVQPLVTLTWDGADSFEEGEPISSLEPSAHPGYPECVCCGIGARHDLPDY